MDTSPDPPPTAHTGPLPPPAPAAPNSTTRLHDDPADVINPHLRPLFQPVFSFRPSVQGVDEGEDGSSFGLRPLFWFGLSTSAKVPGMLDLLHTLQLLFGSDTCTIAGPLPSKRNPRPWVGSTPNPTTFRDIEPPIPGPLHEPEAEPYYGPEVDTFHEPEVEPARLETKVLDAYLQELIGCEGVQRIDQWTWTVQGWDEQGCILKVSSLTYRLHGRVSRR